MRCTSGHQETNRLIHDVQENKVQFMLHQSAAEAELLGYCQRNGTANGEFIS